MRPKDLVPLNGIILVVDAAKEEITASGIVIPETSESGRIIEGEVLAVSSFLLENGQWMETPIKVGFKVAYSQHAGAGNTWKDDSDMKLYRLVKWNEILAVNNGKEI